MASIQNNGSQLITTVFKMPAKGATFGRWLRFGIKPGVAEGFALTNPSGNTIQVGAGHVFLDSIFDSTDNLQYHVQTQTAFNLTATQIQATFDDYLITRFVYSEATLNYAAFEFRSVNDAPVQNEVILGRITYDGGGNVTAVTTEDRTQGFLFNDGSDYHFKFDKFIEIYDVAEPPNATYDNAGRLYKKLGDPGLYWKPDSGGAETNLTQGGGGTGDVSRMILGFNDSLYKFAYQTLFADDGDTFVNTGSSTATDGVDRWIFDTLGDTVISTNDLVGSQFVENSNLPINRVQAVLQYEPGLEDETPGVRISRDGGQYYRRVGVTPTSLRTATSPTDAAIHDETNQDSSRDLDAGAARTYLGQRFIPTERSLLVSVDLYLERTSTPGGRYKVQIRNNGGSNLPGTLVYAESDWILSTDISTTISFTKFELIDPFIVETSASYHIVLLVEDPDDYDYVISSSDVVWGADSGAGYLSGSSRSNDGVSFASDGDDFIFKAVGKAVYGEPDGDLIAGDVEFGRDARLQKGQELVFYSETNANSEAILDDGTVSSGFGQFGQRFRVGKDFAISKLRVYLERTGSPGGLIQLSIYSDNGANEPDLELQMADNRIKANSIATSAEFRDFIFNTPFEGTAGVDYWFVLEGVTGDIGNYAYTGANYIGVQTDSSSTFAQGGIIGWDATPTPWGTEDTAQAACFRIEGAFNQEDIITFYDIENDSSEQTDFSGNSGSTRRLAQSITVPQNTVLKGAELYMDVVGSPGGKVYLEVKTNAGGEPSGAAALTTSFEVDIEQQVPSSVDGPTPVRFEFSTPILLDKNTTYWIIARTDADYTYSAGVDELRWYRDTTSPSYETTQGSATFTGASWTTDVNKDFLFYALGFDAELLIEITGHKLNAELEGYSLWYSYDQAQASPETGVSAIQLTDEMRDSGAVPYGDLTFSPYGNVQAVIDNHVFLPEAGDFTVTENVAQFNPIDLVGVDQVVFQKTRNSLVIGDEVTRTDLRLLSLPEPIVTRFDTETIELLAGGGARAFHVKMPDGKILVGADGLRVSFNASKNRYGGLGLDTGSESNDEEYYIYAVERAYKSLGVVFSTTPPSGGGPLGYRFWKYLGRLWNDSSGDILYPFTDEIRVDGFNTRVSGAIRFSTLTRQIGSLLTHSDDGTEATRITANSSGIITVNFSVQATSGVTLFNIKKNGNTTFNTSGVYGFSSPNQSVSEDYESSNVRLQMISGDFVRFFANNSNVGSTIAAEVLFEPFEKNWL
jgi:hypothetical protein